MKNIEIKTTQNVILQYELAELRDRILAFVIDFICMIVGISLISAIGFSAFASSETASIIFTIFLFCIFIFYSLAFEVFNNGQSLGKMAMRIQVIKTMGGQASFSDYAARWVFRMVDIYFSFGGVACILIASSSRGQRIGDIVANTAVVKISSNINLTLKDLLTIRSQESYKPQFVQGKHLVEQDVLLIKNALERYRKFNNQAHQEAIQLLAQKIKSVLGLQDVQMENRQFLVTIMNDYVVLTR
jgi:uncharacterized RDD family membrane protein YckC